MANLTINPDFKDRRVSHHNCCKTIGEHSQPELKDLAIEARRSGNRILLECFKDLPALEVLLGEKTTAQIAAVVEPDSNAKK